MSKLCNCNYYAQSKGIDKDLLWETWADFKRDHDMVLSNWLSNSSILIEGDEYNTTDLITGEYKPAFSYYVVEPETIDDIRNNSIDIPYYENKPLKLFVISVPFKGASWSEINLSYICN